MSDDEDEESRENLNDKLISLTNKMSIKELKDMISKIEYHPKLEILPDIIYANIYNTYSEEGGGKYKPLCKTVNIGSWNPIILKNAIIIYHNKQLCKLTRFKNKIEIQSLIDVIINDFVCYRNDMIIYLDEDFNVNILRYEDNKLMPITMNNKVQIIEGNLDIMSGDCIIMQNKVVKIDLENLLFRDVVIDDLLEKSNKTALKSIGKREKILVMRNDSEGEEEGGEDKYSIYLYDLYTMKYSLVLSNVPIKEIRVFGCYNILINNNLYKYYNNELIFKRKISYIPITADLHYVINDKDQSKSIYKTEDNILLDLDINPLIFALPNSNIEIIFEEYRKLIPDMIPTNIKNIILELLRSD